VNFELRKLSRWLNLGLGWWLGGLTGVGFLQKHSDEGEDLRGQGWKVDKEEGQYCEGFARKSYCEDEVMSNE
jgi:hypothetical protein